MRVLRWFVVVSVFGVVIACGSGTLPSAPELDELAAVAENNQTSAKPVTQEAAFWDLKTPAPEGKAQCTMVVKVLGRVLKKDPKAKIKFGLFPVLSGEAQIDILGKVLDSGFQPGPDCDIFHDAPSQTKFLPLMNFAKKGKTRVRMKFELQLHAHKGSDCSAAGKANGAFEVFLKAKVLSFGKRKELRVRVSGCK